MNLISLAHNLVDIILHLDQHLNEWITQFGSGIYFLMFLIVFAETGLVIFPFLPGDSLLFALGALTSGDNPALQLPLLCLLLIVAAVWGDAVNYSIGKFAGHKLFANPKSKLFKQAHLKKAQEFYDRHGAKAIILARFVPILRTFAPFVAGMAGMQYRKFFLFNVVGGVAWVGIITVAGHIFGNLPIVKTNFHIVIVAIIVVSLIPVAIEAWNARQPNSN